MAYADSPLAEPVRNGDLTEVMRLLAAGEDPNVVDVVGETPLFEAAASGHLEIMAALLINRGDPHKRSQSDMRAEDLAQSQSAQVLLQLFAGQENIPSDQIEEMHEKLDPDTSRQVKQQLLELAVRQKKQQQSFYVPDAAGDHKQASAEIDTESGQEELPLPSVAQAPLLAEQNEKLSLANQHIEKQLPAADASVSAVKPVDLFESAEVGEELLRATQDGNLESVLVLLKQGADPNVCDAVGETPLFEAAAAAYFDIIAVLLMHRADPSRRSIAGMVSSDLAADRHVRKLIQVFQDEAVDSEAGSAALDPLSQGIRQQVEEHLGEKLQLLRSAPAPLPAESDSADDASASLAVAVEKATDISYIKKGEDSHGIEAANSASGLLLASAIRDNNLSIVGQLLEEGADANFEDELGESALFEAVTVGNPDIIAVLVLHRADPCKRSSSGMVPADFSANDSVTILLKLLSGDEVEPDEELSVLDELSDSIRSRVKVHLANHQMDVASAIQSSLEATIHARPPQTANASEAILTAIAMDSSQSEPEEEREEEANSTELHRAVSAGDLDEVLRLLEASVDINACDSLGETALFEAAANGNAEITAALLAAGADPTKENISFAIPSDMTADKQTQLLLGVFEGRKVPDKEAAQALMKSLSSRVGDMLWKHPRGSTLANHALSTSASFKTWQGEEISRNNDSSHNKEDTQATKAEEAASGEVARAAAEAKDGEGTKAAEARAAAEAEKGEAARTDEAYEAHLKKQLEVEGSTSEAVLKEATEDDLPEECTDPNEGRHIRLPEASSLDEDNESSATAPRQTQRDPSRVKGMQPSVAANSTADAAPDAKAPPSPLRNAFSARSEGVATGNVALAAPSPKPVKAEPTSRSAGAMERFEVMHRPLLAVRQLPSSSSSIVLRLSRGDVVELGEWDASGSWRRVIEVLEGAAAGTRPAEGWVLMKHDVFGELLQRQVSDKPKDLPLAAFAEARQRLQPGTQSSSAATQALIEVFRTGRVSDPEQQRALAQLDPRTVRCVLTASLQHLRESGVQVCVQSRSLPHQGKT